MLVVSKLPADIVAVWKLIWLRNHAAGLSVSQHKERKDEAPVDRDWLMGSRPVELVRWAPVHLLSQALMNASLIELLNPMLQPS